MLDIKLLLASLCLGVGAVVMPPKGPSTITVAGQSPAGAGVPLEAFVSYSIEFSSFPDFAGNSSSPNTFSNNLLNNIGNLTGTKPYIRVGGNTQDYALFNASLETATFGIINPNRSSDYPTTLSIGPSYFDSYSTWPDTKFIHGFNLGKNGTAARQSLLATVPLVCRALENGKLAYWELGNEPDLYKTSAQGPVRPATWNEQTYVAQWLNGTRAIRAAMQEPCPDLTTNALYKYIAPSFAGTGGNNLDPIVTWEDGLDVDKDIALISSHNYIGGATQPGVTLQGTLMNHTSTVVSISHQLNESRLLAALPDSIEPNLPFILGETNSLYNEGAPGLSNSFGAALWGVDFNLWIRVMAAYRHRPRRQRHLSPYYGNIAVAAFLGDLTSTVPRIANLPLPNEEEAAYAAYVNDTLARIVVINMQEYNSSTQTNNYTDDYPRPVERYSFQLPQGCSGKATTQRLLANGSDAITGITFDGYSYNYELDNGMPVLLNNVTRGETVSVDRRGRMSVDVPRSSAVIVRLECEAGCK
ncbi:hypothetical protein H2203_004225 [Taxawa tesnikishii (nom. ined.)]|nr:hypothetical protein H2203_004225 [Dothideales sp. JES 119]